SLPVLPCRRAPLGVRGAAEHRALRRLPQDHRRRRQSRDRENPRLRAARRTDPVDARLQGARVHLLPAQGARARRRRLPDLPRSDRAHAGGGRRYRARARPRSRAPGRAAPATASADDGLVRRLSPPRERDARHARAARLHRLPPRRRGRARPSRRALVRTEILTTAAELFRARGYRATTLDELARRLGMSKATVYGYFRSKEDLLAAIFHRTMTLAEAGLAAIRASALSPADQLREVIRHHVRLVVAARGREIGRRLQRLEAEVRALRPLLRGLTRL